jgi:TrmH family RNA methyltransferase
MWDPALRSPLAAVDVVLVRPQGAINVGAVARLVKNFGARRLVLVNPLADPCSREACMFADRAQDVLRAAARLHSLEEALADAAFVLGTSSKIRAATSAPPLGPRLAAALLPKADEGTLALVFGNEAEGLTREEAARCQRVVRLEAPGPYESFNLSHAVAITLSLLAGADEDEGLEAPASVSERARLEATWLCALERAGYFVRRSPASFAPRLAELLVRMAPRDDDVRLLHDMLAVLSPPAPPGEDP